jgi:hypothetical protein
MSLGEDTSSEYNASTSEISKSDAQHRLGQAGGKGNEGREGSDETLNARCAFPRERLSNTSIRGVFSYGFGWGYREPYPLSRSTREKSLQIHVVSSG